jgi:hypothetical protein
MTLSGQTKPPKKQPLKVEEPEAPKKEPTQLDLLLKQLKEEKPQTYDVYLNAVKAKKSVSIYPDLSIRIG